jgi:hypothetical protein
MQHCYLCGTSIPGDGYRRTVQTGSSSWSSMGWGRRGSYRTGSGTRQGLRTVCASCAGAIDRRNQNSFISGCVVFAGLVVAGLYGCSNISSTPKAEANEPASRPAAAYDAPAPVQPPPIYRLPSKDTLPRCGGAIQDRCYSGE